MHSGPGDPTCELNDLQHRMQAIPASVEDLAGRTAFVKQRHDREVRIDGVIDIQEIALD